MTAEVVIPVLLVTAILIGLVSPFFAFVLAKREKETLWYQFWHGALLLFWGIPVVISLFPIPFAMPICIICMSIDKGDPWPAIIFLSWSIIGFVIIMKFEKVMLP